MGRESTGASRFSSVGPGFQEEYAARCCKIALRQPYRYLGAYGTAPQDSAHTCAQLQPLRHHWRAHSRSLRQPHTARATSDRASSLAVPDQFADTCMYMYIRIFIICTTRMHTYTNTTHKNTQTHTHTHTQTHTHTYTCTRVYIYTYYTLTNADMEQIFRAFSVF